MSARLKPYWLHAYLLTYTPLLLLADSRITALWQQWALGALTFVVLYLATLKAPREQRLQVWMCVIVATGFEVFGSLIWGVYRYRLHNVPMFVPPGHGLVYLFGLLAMTTPVVKQPAIFIATGELEIFGTSFGNWNWLPVAPWTHIPSGNPPSVIAGGYCVIDASVLLAMRAYRAGLNTIITRIPITMIPRIGPSMRLLLDRRVNSGEAVSPASANLIWSLSSGENTAKPITATATNRTMATMIQSDVIDQWPMKISSSPVRNSTP